MSPRISRPPAIRRKRRMPLIAGIIALLLLLAVVRAMTITPRPTRSFLDDSGPVIIAHQGASGHAPSNTMEAFWLALEQGADILELDLFITKDGVMVVSHDETIDRMSNGTGYIKDMTLAEVRQFDFGYTFSPDGGQTSPTGARMCSFRP
jgi:glycerophosphoryl diester phosphodiesterase